MTKIAIGAIMKQEAPYILEWVYYYKTLGFEIIIADNGGEDGTSSILNALHLANIIHRIDVRSFKKSPQVPAYRAILRYARQQKIDFIGFLDCDEFFTKSLPIKSLSPEAGAEYISSEFEKKLASQISYHWICYGSKTEFHNPELPVLERFTYHSTLDANRNIRIKSFVRVSDMFKFSNIFYLGPFVHTPHYSITANSRWYIDNEPVKRFSMHKTISHQTGAILHFPIKTWEEYQQKMKRGEAHVKWHKNTKEYFDKNDLNDIQHEIDENIVAQIKSGILALQECIREYQSYPINTNFYEKMKVQLMAFGLSNKNSGKWIHKFLVKAERIFSSNIA